MNIHKFWRCFKSMRFRGTPFSSMWLWMTYTSSWSPPWQPSSPWQVFKRYVINFDKDLPQLRTNSENKHRYSQIYTPRYSVFIGCFPKLRFPRVFLFTNQDFEDVPGWPCYTLPRHFKTSGGMSASSSSIRITSPVLMWIEAKGQAIGEPQWTRLDTASQWVPRTLRVFVCFCHVYKKIQRVFGVCLGCFCFHCIAIYGCCFSSSSFVSSSSLLSPSTSSSSSS